MTDITWGGIRIVTKVNMPKDMVLLADDETMQWLQAKVDNMIFDAMGLYPHPQGVLKMPDPRRYGSIINLDPVVV